jgi:hypothetical protein
MLSTLQTGPGEYIIESILFDLGFPISQELVLWQKHKWLG